MPSLRPFALYYFCYFAYSGLFGPFWSLYLQSLNFSAWEISVLVALSTLARIAAPGFWGWLADRQGRRRAIIIATSVLAGVAFAALCVGPKAFAWVFGCLAFAHFFWAASLPLVEASTAHLTRANPGRYSRVRVWGSIGYMILAIGSGYVLDALTIDSMPWLTLGLLVLVALVSFRVPDVQTAPRSVAREPLRSTLMQPRVIALFTCCFLMAFAFGPYYTFYSIALKEAGYDKSLIGWFWAIGVVCEILVFWFMPRIMKRFSLETLMLASLVAGVARFAMIALGTGLPASDVLSQSLHALTFAIHHAAAVGLIHRYFDERHQAQGQGLYIVASFGVGGSAGGLLAGALWPQGGVALCFGLSAIACLLGVLVSLKALPPPRSAAPAA
ncbi:MFS transporter [Paludibacterium paludis]|uniref:MFS metabolite transporter n=1 Tax=Paludibacterium paludis TaxID=1225769 RepID=A0A918NYI2_9NEIS|nr:MFS transporter [Paludibacterium paludis]GGY06845.1 MFS metabolite transporter [Paludibacterium paludis]